MIPKHKLDTSLPKKLDNETPAQFHMFQEWAYMGPGRNATSLAAKFDCTPKHIYALAKKFDWRDRAAKYDIEKARERRDAIVERNAKYKEQERQMIEGIYGQLLKLGNRLSSELYLIENAEINKYGETSKHEDIRLSRQLLTLSRYTRLLKTYRKLLGIQEPSLLETLPAQVAEEDPLEQNAELLEKHDLIEELTEEMYAYIAAVGDTSFLSPESIEDAIKCAERLYPEIMRQVKHNRALDQKFYSGESGQMDYPVEYKLPPSTENQLENDESTDQHRKPFVA